MKSEIEWKRMMEGKLYHPGKVGDDSWDKVHEAVYAFNASYFWKDRTAFEQLKKCFGRATDTMVLTPPVYFDHGDRIFFGNDFYANTGLTILDENQVIFGDRVYLAPHVSIYTASHPIDSGVRSKDLEYAHPVVIGSDVWIGGNVVINPGVTIGSNVVIGSGSVVTKDIPDGVVAAGNPCRILRKIDEIDQMRCTKEYEEYLCEIQNQEKG